MTKGALFACDQREDGASLRLRTGEDGHGNHVLPNVGRLHQVPQVCVSIANLKCHLNKAVVSCFLPYTLKGEMFCKYACRVFPTLPT